MFIDIGYTATSSKMVSRALNISPGNITYYFALKEDILAVLIQMLSDFQWETVRKVVDDGETPITALCFELTAMAAMCEESEVAKDLYISAYTNQKSLEVIRKNDMRRAKSVFSEFCASWTDQMFAEAETIVSGIEYATLTTTSISPPLEMRIAGAMEAILNIYHVPEERRNMKIDRALSLDYLSYGRELFSEFKDYVLNLSEEHFEYLLKNRYI